MKAFRKTMFCILSFMILFLSISVPKSLVNVSAADFSGGDGSVDNPYVVSEAKHLYNVRYYGSKYFTQSADIDLSEYEIFYPIGSYSFPFAGNYNGNGFKIQNLTQSQNGDFVGLFAYLTGYAYNINLVNANITGNKYVGTIAGGNSGLIRNCSVSDSEVTGKSGVGGITGYNDGEISKTFTEDITITLSENYYSGGIAGINNGIIKNCYNNADISSENTLDYIGGIAGLNSGENAIIESTFFAGSLTGNITGAIVGRNINAGTILNSVWLKNPDYNAAGFISENFTGVQELEAAQFLTGNAFDNWDKFSTDWEILRDANFPSLKYNDTERFWDIFVPQNLGKQLVTIKVRDALTSEIIPDGTVIILNGVPRYPGMYGEIRVLLDIDKYWLEVKVTNNDNDVYIPHMQLYYIESGDLTVYMSKPSYDLVFSETVLTSGDNQLNLMDNSFEFDKKSAESVFNISTTLNVPAETYNFYVDNEIYLTNSTGLFEDIDLSLFTNENIFSIQAVYRGIYSEKISLNLSIKKEEPVIPGDDEDPIIPDDDEDPIIPDDNKNTTASSGCFGSVNFNSLYALLFLGLLLIKKNKS